jgi:tRNA1Val (adenine37-N6)-methyltransferase
MKPHFRFKQFELMHERSVMKVGTDGVLLGALCDPGSAGKILDAGTGCGLIALMLAQKCKAEIHGIDIDEASIEEARLNATNSPWNDRLKFIHRSLQEYTLQHAGEYDLMVSNPPFFADSLLSPSFSKSLAKHNVQLDMDELLSSANILLNADGKLWLIIPSSNTPQVAEKALQLGMLVGQQISIHPKQGRPSHRDILLLTKDESTKPISTSLCIRDQDGSYTEEYRNITADYYLSL